MKWFEYFRKNGLLGVHLALNIFVATSLLWLILREMAHLDPIWAISSMIASSDPDVKQAFTFFRGRIINALLGCAVGLLFLIFGGSSEWKLPIALSVTVLLTSYVVRVPTMWRQAPITAALVIASELIPRSDMTPVQIGLHRVGEVMLGCVAGVTVSWLMSKVWPVPEAENESGAAAKL